MIPLSTAYKLNEFAWNYKMKIVLNGNDADFPSGALLTQVVESTGMPPERVATIVNENVVSRDQRAATELNDGDIVEILTLAGGG